jgi:hypothetical protein
MPVNRSRRNLIKAGLAGAAAVGANIAPRAQTQTMTRPPSQSSPE